jgi:hypothetical protein
MSSIDSVAIRPSVKILARTGGGQPSFIRRLDGVARRGRQ